MSRAEILNKIFDKKVVAVIRIKEEEKLKKVVEAIELTLQMIRMGNLSGNTFDYILYRVSLGRLGVDS